MFRCYEKAQLGYSIWSLPYHDLHYDLQVHCYPRAKLCFKGLPWQKEHRVYM